MSNEYFSRRRRHTRFDCDWSSDVCSSDLADQIVLGQRLTTCHDHFGNFPWFNVLRFHFDPRLDAKYVLDFLRELPHELLFVAHDHHAVVLALAQPSVGNHCRGDGLAAARKYAQKYTWLTNSKQPKRAVQGLMLVRSRD